MENEWLQIMQKLNDLEKTCANIEKKIDSVQSKLEKLEKSASNMDRHVSFVESFMLPIVNPFLRILRLR